jgi:pimeloyl-ACP methyl ester carboxylesterase
VCRERVRRLALVAPGGLGREVALGLRLASLPGGVEQAGEAWMGVGTRIGMRLAGGEFEADDVEALAWMNAQPGTARAFARTVRDVIDLRGQRRSFLERVHEVAELPPMALYWGTRDRVIPARQARAVLARMEGVHFAEFDACGHFPHRERAARFVEMLTAFADAPQAPPVKLVRAVAVPVQLRHPGVLTRMARAIGRALRGWFGGPVAPERPVAALGPGKSDVHP